MPMRFSAYPRRASRKRRQNTASKRNGDLFPRVSMRALEGHTSRRRPGARTCQASTCVERGRETRTRRPAARRASSEAPPDARMLDARRGWTRPRTSSAESPDSPAVRSAESSAAPDSPAVARAVDARSARARAAIIVCEGLDEASRTCEWMASRAALFYRCLRSLGLWPPRPPKYGIW